MGKTNPTLRSRIYRLNELIEKGNKIGAQLNHLSISPGKRQSLLKERILIKGKISHLAKYIEDMAQGNILTITFIEEKSQDRFRIVYTNLSQEDAAAHLRLYAKINNISIKIIEMKEVQTANSLTKL